MKLHYPSYPHPTGLINAGFSRQHADISALWHGALSPTSLTTKAPSIIFRLHPFGVVAGDIEQLRLMAPEGKTIIECNAEIKSPNRRRRPTPPQRNAGH